MATKSTLKNKKFNKAELAKKLDKLSHDVAQRGVFVARKNKYAEFDVFDYVNKQVYYDNFPNQETAQTMCNTLNKRKKSQGLPYVSKKIKEVCNSISKHNTDCAHYLHIITTTDDSFRRVALETRLKESQGVLKFLMKDLRALI